jgi:Cu(I)/Ag(I) efflux system protein CusF
MTQHKTASILHRVAAILAVTAASYGLQVRAQTSTPTLPRMASVPATAERASFVFGKVVSIEPADGTIVIDHEDIPNLGMSPMAMEFQVKDRSVLARLKPGDAVRFRGVREAGQYVAADLAPR